MTPIHLPFEKRFVVFSCHKIPEDKPVVISSIVELVALFESFNIESKNFRYAFQYLMSGALKIALEHGEPEDDGKWRHIYDCGENLDDILTIVVKNNE